MRQMMSRFVVRRLAALALIFFVPVPAAADDAIMSMDQYKTSKARTLATTHESQLKRMREEIYYCMPWVGVQKSGIGFRQPRFAVEDDRYLSVWIVIDQDEDARFSALPPERRASAMLSRYGTDLLRRMTSIQPVVADPNVYGFSVVLSWLKPGTGKFVVNGKESNDYFARPVLRMMLASPLVVTNRTSQFDIFATVVGGGLSGQAGALRHGISKALTYFEPALRPALKAQGFLTRDSRVVERKKYGKPKARRSFQFSKR